MSDAQQLTTKQALFIAHYLECWNATEAAKKAGYSEKTAYSIGQENLKKPEIKSEIERRKSELLNNIIPQNGILYRLTEQTTATLDDFFTIDMEEISEKRQVFGDVEQEDGTIKRDVVEETITTYQRPVVRLDLKRAKESGKLHLVKKYNGKTGSIELHDPQAAMKLLGQFYGMWVDRTELSGPGGEPIRIQQTSELTDDELLAIASASRDGTA